MKKILALVLVLCLVLGLVACSKPVEQEPEITTAPTTGETSFAGKTLEVYGKAATNSYTDYSAFGKGSYSWMMRAAMDEWAAMNGVTIKYCGDYTQNVILAAMASGEKPDIIIQVNNFPTVANYGIVQAWTEEEYNTLAEIIGNKQYLDMMEYKTKSYGLVLPWTGTMMMYFNQSMFERYDVKSPLEYFNEGTWTWENFEKMLKEMTRDLDGDGTTDTYGTVSATWTRFLNPMTMDDAGRVLNLIDEPYMYDYFQMKYNSYAVDMTTGGSGLIQNNVTYPMAATQLSDCEPYNFEHVFQYISNGDALIAVPAPEWTSSDGKTQTWRQLTQSCVHLAASCDEREAAFDLICYLVKCGLKYISDYSLGAIKCDYAGIQGTSDLSKQWKEAFTKVVEDRKIAVKELEIYDEAHMTKINDYFNSITGWHAFTTYGGITSLLGYAEWTKMPPASAIPAVKEKYQAALDKYNELYVFED